MKINFIIYIICILQLWINKTIAQSASAASRVFPNRGISISNKTSLEQFECLRSKGFKDYVVIDAFKNNAPNPHFFYNYHNAVKAGYTVIDLSFQICPTMQNSTLYLNNIMKNFFYNIPIYNNQTSQNFNILKHHNEDLFDMFLRKNIIVKFDSFSEGGCIQWKRQSFKQNCKFFNDTVNMLQLTYLQDFGVQTNRQEWIDLFGHQDACNSQEEQYPINYYPLIWTGDQSGNPNFNTKLYHQFAGQIIPQLKVYQQGYQCGGNIEFISF